jgi:phosphatidylserine/phosphatidylglycerophosphate/cardiolipin synthase-like enzyme
MVNALIELEERGVNVRVVTDTDNAELDSIARLRRNGISVIEDDKSALMHNKFVVIDGRYTWMGAMNFTTNGAYCNNNNIVRLDSPELAANYTAEMDEMYDRGEFGPTSTDDTPNEQLTIGGVRVENYFASEKELAPLMGELISQAQNDIRFMAFSFTHEDVGEAMLERAEAGVNVQGVFETTGSETEYSYYGPMNEAGMTNLQVRQDGNRRLMHHKVIIIDGQTTIFGSFNFSGSANDSNDENVLIVHDPTFASYFLEEFNTVWNEARP